MAQRNQYSDRLLLLRKQETSDSKACIFCDSVKPLSEFYKCAGQYKGVAGRCKECHKRYMKDRKQRTKELRREWKYGLSAEQYDTLLISQDRCCAICDARESGHPSGELLVDHDHLTGEVRGLLCSACNVALGHFRDNPTLLLGALGYLIAPPAREVLR